MRFRKKPVEIEAVRFEGDEVSAIAVRLWQYRYVQSVGHPAIWFFTAAEASPPITVPEGADAVVYDYLHKTWVGVEAGSWIIKGIQGEFYPCKADVFEATYDPVEEEA